MAVGPVARWPWAPWRGGRGPRGKVARSAGRRELTSLVYQELVEVAQALQAGVLGGLVGVLAQNPQHAHQLPEPLEVLFRLRGEWGPMAEPTHGAPCPALTPAPGPGASRHVAGLGLGWGEL